MELTQEFMQRFIQTWQASDNRQEIAKKLELTYKDTIRIGVMLRNKGVKLKHLKSGRPRNTLISVNVDFEALQSEVGNG